MAHLDRRFQSTPYPHILNSVNYANAEDLYGTSSGKLTEGKSRGFRKRNGLAITVTIPPSLRAFRYPNMTNLGAPNYFMSEDDKNAMKSRNEWYKAAKANSNNADKAIVTLSRRLRDLRAKRAQYVRAGNTVKVAQIDAQIESVRAQLATVRTGSSATILGTYSTEFEITDFVTSLSWSSAFENSFVDVNIGLDNVQGLFNYLPEGAKVTIWRRKSTSNVNGLYGGKWYRYITCYVMNKTRSASGRDQTMDINCGDRLSVAGSQNYEAKKKWVKDKSHPKGWTPREITLQICKATGLPVDAAFIPNSYIIKKKVTVGSDQNRRKKVEYVRVTLPRIEYDEIDNTDLPSLIIGAWNRSLEKLSRSERLPFSMHMRSGSLRIEFVAPPGDPMTQTNDTSESRRSHLVPMFTDEENIESITLEESIEPEEVYTALKATGTYKYYVYVKGKKRTRTKKVTKTFYPSGTRGDLVLKAFGKRLNVYNFGKKKKHVFDSKQDFYKAAQQRIDNISRPKRTLSLDGLGPLGIWPKHYVYVASRYVGVRGNIWVESVNYNIEEGKIKISLQLNASKKHFSSGEAFFTSKRNRLGPESRWY